MIKQNSTPHSPKRIVENINWINGKYPTRIFEKTVAKRFLNNRLLAAQSEEIYEELIPYLESVSLNGGEYLYQPGDHVDFVYFPETAVVSEFSILEDGRTVEIAMTGNEGVLGLLPLFNSGNALNWTQVSVNGTAARINNRILEKKISRHPEFQKTLFEYITQYVQQISQRSVCNSYHVIEQRFCSWLLMIQDRKKSNKIPLTQEQIARSLGVHRPSLTHIAQNLRAKKIIDYVRGKIYILDRAELENSACACFSEICGGDKIH
ncbi:MAG TPA: Crp/Fnr family transcriptional regulator [Pyrinomonadaceae bacterium]|jgi:CRP-like cAMP-binding protein